MLSFLEECQQCKFDSQDKRKRIFHCEDAIAILQEILPKIANKNDIFQINTKLIISLVGKISVICGKSSISSIKSTEILKSILANPFFLKQIMFNEETMAFIFDKCFLKENQSFFVIFLNDFFFHLHDTTNDTSILRNLFFETLRKTFASLHSNEKKILNEKGEKVENDADIWKAKILCQIFQNLLISSSGNQNYEYFKFQEVSREDHNHFLWDYNRLTKKVT